MDDDVDIYADILSKVTATPDKVHVRLEQEISQLKAALENCQREKSELQTKNDKLSANISSLYRTAKLEIRRKNALIEELRNQQRPHHSIQGSQRFNDKDNRRVLEDGQAQPINVNDRLRDGFRSDSQENRCRSDKEYHRTPEDGKTQPINVNDRPRDGFRSNSQENRCRSDKEYYRTPEDGKTQPINVNDRSRDDGRSLSQENRRRSDKEYHRAPEDGKTQPNNVNDRPRDDGRSLSQENRRRSDKEYHRAPDDCKTQLNNVNDRLRDDCRSRSQESRRRSDREHQDNRPHSINNRYSDNHRSNSHENRYRSEKDHCRGPDDCHMYDKSDRRSQDKYNARKNDHLKEERRSRSSQNEHHSKDRRYRLDNRSRENGHLQHVEHHRLHRDSLHRPHDRRSPKERRLNEALNSQDEQYLLEKRRMLKERLAKEDRCLREQSKVDINEKQLREIKCRRRSRPENDFVDSSLVDTPMKMCRSEFTTTAFVKLISPLGATPDHIKAKFNDMIKLNTGVPAMLNEVRNDYESYSVTRTQDIKSVAIMASKIENETQSTVILSQNNIRLHAVEPEKEPSTIQNECVPESVPSHDDAKLNVLANEIESPQSVVQLQNDLISVEHGAFRKRIKRRPIIRIVDKTNVEVESC